MKIYYQGIIGAYTHINSLEVAKDFGIGREDVYGLSSFAEVWKKIKEDDTIGVLPIENSYAGPIHENLYKFLHYDYEIIGEIYFEVNHCLLSKETDLSKISKVYSHPQALGQCYKFLSKNGIKSENFFDTASAAQMVARNSEPGISAVASRQAGEIYGLNILKKNIQDQEGNTTRFFIVTKKGAKISFSKKAGKCSIIFSAKNIPSSLYKCLGAFATNSVNLTKIESLPNPDDGFNYIFWLDFEGSFSDENVKKAISELEFFTSKIRILGEY